MILGPGTLWYDKQQTVSDSNPWLYLDDESGDVHSTSEVYFLDDGEDLCEVYTEFREECFMDLPGGPKGVIRLARGRAELSDAELYLSASEQG